MQRHLLKLLAGTAIAVIGTGFAQAGDTVIKMSGQGWTGKAVQESTASFFPQISYNSSPRKLMPEHTPPLRFAPSAQQNSLRAGGVIQANRLNVLGGFNGVDDTNTGCPADPYVAAGPSDVVEVVNTSIAIFSKTGTQTFRQTLNQFFASVGSASTFVFDPKVLYDPGSGRYFVIALDSNSAITDTGTDSYILVGVSPQGTATGTWNKYRISVVETGTANFWLDYPGWGMSKDAIVCTGNMFQIGGNGFNGAQHIILRKAELIAGSPALVTKFADTDPESFTAQIAKNYDVNDTHAYGLSVEPVTGPQSNVTIYGYSNLGTTNPTLVKTKVSVPSFEIALNHVSSVNGIKLDVVTGRILNSAVRNGRLYGAHTIITSSGAAETKARWYSVKTNGWPEGSSQPTLEMAGDLAPTGSGESIIMPSVMPDNIGNLTLLATRTSPSIVADVIVAGRNVGDPAGTLATPQTLFNSNNVSSYSCGGGRWGDYFGMSMDPDGRSIWGVAMYLKSNENYGTRIIKVAAISPESGTITGPASILTIAGTPSTTDATTAKSQMTTKDGNSYSVTSGYNSGVGQYTDIQVSFTAPKAAADTSSLILRTVESGATGSSGFVFVYNYKTGRYDLLKTTSLTTSLQTIDVSPSDLTQYISSGKQVKVLLRTVSPIRPGQVVAPFIAKIDQCVLITV